MWAIALILGLGFLYQLYKYILARKSEIWTNQGIQFLYNDISILDLLTGRKKFNDSDVKFYDQLGDKKFGGGLEFGTPIFYVKDLDLARHIYIKDIDYFFDRRDFAHTDVLFGQSLFFLEGQLWKDVRSFLSPTFTSGKIRRMFPHFNQTCQKMLNFIKTQSPKGCKLNSEGYDITVPETMRKFSLEMIGSAAFGMNINCFADSNSLFYKMAEKVAALDTEKIVRFGIYQSFPKFADFINLQILPSAVIKFFQEIISQALRVRESSPTPSDDFLQLLVEAKRGNMQIDESELNDAEKDAQLKPAGGKKPKLQLTEPLIVGQAFLFLAAGFDSVSNNLSVAVYLLAAYPEIQEKILKEVDEIIQSTKGKITYEAVNRMEYLDMFVSEVLRLYPAVVRLERKCMKDYVIPGTDKVIPYRTIVAFVVDSFHRDEKYYPDPLKFDPERFSAENKASRNPYAYMPFGIGPRNCIGMRFALVETKAAIAQIVYNFKVVPTEKTPIPVEISREIAGYRTPGDLKLRFVPRNFNNTFVYDCC